LQIEKNLKTFLTYRRATETTRINALEKSNKEEKLLIRNNQKSIEEKKQILDNLKKLKKNNP